MLKPLIWQDLPFGELLQAEIEGREYLAIIFLKPGR